MKMDIVIIFVSILLVTSRTVHSQCGNCTTCFIKEPPNELVCNPYNMGYRKLVCEIQTNTNNITIDWFHQDLENKTMEFKNLTQINEKIKAVLMINQSSIGGQYWCRIFNTTSQEHIGTSNVLTVYESECYNMSKSNCTSEKFILNSNRCIDNTSLSLSNPILPSTCPSMVLSPNKTELDSDTVTSIQTEPGVSNSISFSISQSSYDSASTSYITEMVSSSSTTYHIDTEANTRLTNVHIIIITVTLIMILGIVIIITSCLVIICVYLSKKKKKMKYDVDTNNYVTVDDIQTSHITNQSEMNTSLPSSEAADYLDPVTIRTTFQNEPGISVPFTSDELRTVTNYSVINEGVITTKEEDYDRLKHNVSSEITGSGNIDKGSSEEYSTLGSGNAHVYSTLDADSAVTENTINNSLVYHTKEGFDSVTHTGSGNNHIGSDDDYSTIPDANSHIYHTLEHKEENKVETKNVLGSSTLVPSINHKQQSTLEGDSENTVDNSHVYHTKEECDSVTHTGSGNNCTRSDDDYSTVPDSSSHIYHTLECKEVQKIETQNVLDNQN